MKIQSSLVFDKHSGEIVGFTDLGDPALTFSSFEDEQPVATTVITLLIRGLMTKLELQLLSRSSICSGNLYQFRSPRWTFGALQLQQVVVPQTQNSSSYRKVFRVLHILEAFITQLTYLHQNENCTFLLMYHTSSKQQEIVFTHLAGTMIHTCCGALLHMHTYRDQEGVLQCLPKIILDHIKLSSFGKMKASLAIQVFRKSMANALQFFHPDGEADECTKFIAMVNDFFDMANTRSTTEHRHKRNTNLKPYSDPNDEQLAWMINVFCDSKQVRLHQGTTTNHVHFIANI